MSLFAFLLGAVGPLVARALTYIGISVLTITGVETAFGALQSAAQSSWGGLPVAVLGLASLAGVPEALGIIFGCFNARLALWLATSMTRWAVAKP